MSLLFHTSEKEAKSILVTDTHVHLSTKNHDNIESFEKSLVKKGMLETLDSIQTDNIIKVYYVSGENTVTNALNKKRYAHLKFNNEQDRNSYLEYIAKLKNFIPSEEAQKPFSAASGKLISVGVTIVVTIFLFWLATTMENGEDFEVTGRRSGIKSLIKTVLETLGSAGVAGLGALITAYFAYGAYKVYKNPPNKVVYS